MSQEGKQEITNALASGKEVTLHLNKITANGWMGSGYLVTDSETGAGAYKIASGANGGEITFSGDFLKGLLGGALLGLAVMAIPLQVALLSFGFLGAAVAAGIVGMAATLGTIQLGDVNPLTVATLRGTVATMLVGGLLAFGPSAAISPIALGLFLIWFIAMISLEIALALSVGSLDWQFRLEKYETVPA